MPAPRSGANCRRTRPRRSRRAPSARRPRAGASRFGRWDPDADAVGEREPLVHYLRGLRFAVDEVHTAHRTGVVPGADTLVGDDDADVRVVEVAVRGDTDTQRRADRERLRAELLARLGFHDVA